jgi:hypothetical protein
MNGINPAIPAEHIKSERLADEMKYDDPDPAFNKLISLTAKKITWATAGLASDPGRYMFRFGWLTITADDLAIWEAYPNAAFTLVRTLTSPPLEIDEETVGEEFRLGTFDLRIASTYSAGEK